MRRAVSKDRRGRDLVMTKGGGGSVLRLVPSVLICLAATTGSGVSQTASQITPRTFEPEGRRLEGEIVFSGSPGLEAPEGADELSVTIADVEIAGGFPELADISRAIENSLVGDPVPVSAIFEAAQTLEAAYAQAGYILARVVLPAQTLRDGGVLRLVVVDGYVESTDLGEVPARVRSRIGEVTAPLVGRRGLSLGEIERRLLIAGSTPGTALTSALATGDEPGGTVLTLGAEQRPITGFVAVDNTLAEELGDWALTFGIEANSVLSLGELIYLRASGHPIDDRADDLGAIYGDFPQTRTLAAGAIFPIGTNGLTFNAEAVSSVTTPDVADPNQTTSEFDRLSFRMSYPWLRSQKADLFTEVILELQSEDFAFFEEDGDPASIWRDELTVLRFAVDGRRRLDSGSTVFGGLIASFGLEAFGARTADDAANSSLALSQAGADADFSKLELAAGYTRPVAEHLTFSVYGRGQTSFGEPLLSSEKIGIASLTELATFDAGSLSGDSGWVVRGDVLSPWQLDVPSVPFESVTPYLFGAVGAVERYEAAFFQEDTVRAGSLGVGVELVSVIAPAFSDASIVMEYGRAFRDDGVEDNNRFTFLGSYRF